MPVIDLPTVQTVDDKRNLYTFLFGLARGVREVNGAMEALQRVGMGMGAGTGAGAGAGTTPAASIPAPLSIDAIRTSLESRGSTPLNVTGLTGLLGTPQPAGLIVVSTLPSAAGYELGTLALLSGSPDTLYYVKTGAGGTHAWQIIATAPTDMVTTDTVQNIGPDAAKTFKDLVTMNAGLKITATGETIDAGGLLVTAGGITITAGGMTINGGNISSVADIAAIVNITMSGLLRRDGGNGSLLRLNGFDEEMTISNAATQTNSTGLIPNNALILAVPHYITQTISGGGGPTQIKIGDVLGSAARFFTSAGLLVTNGGLGMDQWKASRVLDADGPLAYSAGQVRVTLDAIPAQGKVRICPMWIEIGPPTS